MAFDGFIGIEIGSVTFTGLDEDGYPVAQCDGNGSAPENAASPLHHPFGFFSLPRDPDVDSAGQIKPGSACMAFYAQDGDETHAWLSYDPRFITVLPQSKKGGSMQYCAWGSFAIFDGDDGTWSLYVPIDDTKAHGVTVGVDGNGDPILSFVHADGMGLVMHLLKTVLKNHSGDAYIELAAGSSCTINANTVVNGGMTIGSPAGALPAAIATHLATYFTVLEATLLQLAALIDGKTPPSAAAVTAVNAFMANIGGTKALIPATKTSIS